MYVHAATVCYIHNEHIHYSIVVCVMYCRWYCVYFILMYYMIAITVMFNLGKFTILIILIIIPIDNEVK